MLRHRLTAPSSFLQLGFGISVVLVFVGNLALAQQANTAKPDLFATVAENSGYTDTANEAEVANYLRELANSWQAAELTNIGATNEGRPLWGLIVEPQVKTKIAPVTVLLLGGIHSGECDGKEALLALARDMATGKQGDWWKGLRIIWVPNFNADANERRGKLHRPGQAGPSDGMGIRENAQGLDLNRDFIKLDSPEVRSLVAALSEYDVDALVDCHTTNGSLHQYQLTYDIPHNPATPASVESWLRGSLMPQVRERLGEKGFNTFWYGNYDRAHGRWSTYGYEPRYSTEYMGLRGKIGILAESYSYASYETRVKVSYHFVEEVLRGLAENHEAVREMIDTVKADPKAGRPLPLRGKIVKTAEGVTTNGYQKPDGSTPRPPYGEHSFAAHEKKDYVVDLWNRAEATHVVDIPKYYVLPAQYAWAASRLVGHGVQIQQLTENQAAKGSVYQVSQVEKLSEFQLHRRLKIEAVRKDMTADLGAGCFVINTNQPLGVLASYLLEPMADDGLAAWNFLDPDCEANKPFPVFRINQTISEDVLKPVVLIDNTEQITLDRLQAPEKRVQYGGRRIRGARWLKNSSDYVITGGWGRTYAVDAATGSRRPLTEMDSFRSKLSELESFSPEQAQAAATISAFTDDWKFATVSHDNDLYFFDAESNEVRQLTDSSDEAEQLYDLSPTGEHIAFVRDNNLWLVDCKTAELKQLTQDGSVELLNGILDWVYQEELYGRGNFKGFWWSPDGSQIAMLQLDQTPVPSYQVSDSTTFGQSLEATRYPKAGQPLPTARVWLVDIATGAKQEVDLSKWESNDRLIGRVTWSPSGQLWLQVFNRVQNRLDLVRVNPETGVTKVLFTEESPGWIEIRGVPEFLPGGEFLWLSDLPSGRTHLFRVNATTGKRMQLTKGEWEIDALELISSDFKTAFVSGNITSPIERQLLAIDLETNKLRQVTAAPGTHRVSLNASGEFFFDVFSSTDSQPVATLHRADGELLRVIEAPVSDRHQFISVDPPSTFAIKARDGVDLQTQLMLPKGFDPKKPNGKLPVLFHVYGGPQAPTVKNEWQSRYYWWHQMLCQQGIAVVLCDNRASRGRGVKDTWTIRGDMCRVELQDLEDAVKWVNEQPWADSERIGLWGWSYGGYFTSYALTHSKLFKCGIAGAPVTDWHNYDAIYTERYMDLPQNNSAGYESSSVVKAAANLHGNLMLIHGERDDNVHISNTFQLVNALQAADKQFDLMVYPRNRHGIVDPKQRYHMFQMMTRFLERHLKPGVPAAPVAIPN